LDDEAGLDQQNNFRPAGFATVLRLANKVAKQSLTPAREECNKYDLTAAAPCF
jgi:hypothetical protein